MKAILLEDEYLLNANIKEYLQFKKMEVESYTDGAILLENFDVKTDIAILDIEVPGATGFEVIKWIRQVNSKIPAIFITAYSDIESIRKGYSLGCSDYLKKPFDLEELWLRITKLLDSPSNKNIEFSNKVTFNLDNEQLYHANKIIKLTKIQKKILKLLIENKNSIVTYEMLIFEIWSDVFIKINTIASHVKEIRKLLPNGIIESVRAEGYLLHL